MSERERFLRVEQLFHELSTLSPQARANRLQELARDEPDTHTELLPLLQSSGRTRADEAALDELAAVAGALGGGPAAPLPDQIGPYRIERLLGEGGMGRVYLARQEQPIRRQVALKVIRTGLDSEQVRARFRAERQALALLDHPNIARVFEAGALTDGRLWFAMEYIDGESITAWARRQQLDLEQRIRLLLPVCEAVQHAHRKGLIHRDLKPSNLLVIDVDGQAQPKVIDFGLARPVELAADGRSFATSFGELLGTPEYMSPEQASLGEVDVDTRSDVFALGLVLYELLVGTLPLRSGELRRRGFQAMCRAIREEQAPRPSSVADGEPGTLRWRHRLRGDVDSVLMKALATDRERRYGTVSALADDLQRYLASEPVLAQPPSLRYRLGKFVRRHRLPVAAMVMVVLALAVGSIVAAFGLHEARRAEALALAAAERADSERRSAQSTAAFLVELFSASDPRSDPGLELTAGELLERGVERIDALDGEPRVQADLLAVLGDVYRVLGQAGRAEPLLERALHLRSYGPAADTVRAVEIASSIAAQLRDRGQLDQAEAMYRSALADLEREGLRGGLVEATVLNELGILLGRSRRLDEGYAAYQQALDIMTRIAPPEQVLDLEWTRRMSTLLGNLATSHSARGDSAAAERVTRLALEVASRHLPEHDPRRAVWHNNLGLYAARRGDLAQAITESGRAVDINDRALSEHHPVAALHRLNLGGLLVRAGRVGQGREHLLRALHDSSRQSGADSLEAARVQRWLGMAAWAEGDLARAHELLQGALRRMQRARDPRTDQQLPRLIARLAELELALDRVDAARDSIADAQRRSDGAPEDRPVLALTRALVELSAGRPESAAQHFQQAQCEPMATCQRHRTEEWLLRAQWWAQTGEPAAALDALEAAVDSPGWYAWMLDARSLDGLRASPRWPALERRLLARRGSPE